jgi:hypothetical protein
MSRDLLIVLLIVGLIILFHLSIIYSLRSGFYRNLGNTLTGLKDPPWRRERRSIQDLRTKLKALEDKQDDES